MAGPAIGFGALVVADVKEDRVGDFLKVLEADAYGSRNPALEPGCIRFDMLRCFHTPKRWYFYEGYLDDDCAAHHKTTAHYKAWADFKASGGLEKQDALKFETVSIPGGYAWQADDAPHSRPGYICMRIIQVKPERIEEFFKVMEVFIKGSRNKANEPNCLRLDLLRLKDNPMKFFTYQVYGADGDFKASEQTSYWKPVVEFLQSGGGVEEAKWEAAPESGGWAYQAATTRCGSLELPLLGFGTYKVGVVPASAASAKAGGDQPAGGPEVVNQVIADAVQSGYRCFDCAEFYGNERWIGDALRKSALPRSSLTLISKVWNSSIWKGPQAVKVQVEKSISDLQVEYLDIVMVHWPVPGKHVDAYKALTECKKEGKIKEIGLSNYCIEDYEELRDAGAFGPNDVDKPVINQILFNAATVKPKSLDFFRKEGVHIQSYRGLAEGPRSWESPVLREVCKETAKTPSQVLGRFLVQQGISHIPKTTNAGRMKENAEIFGFRLTPTQMEKLATMTTPETRKKAEDTWTKSLWRDTPNEGSPVPGSRTFF